tara:strand:- start:265 stop:510 length:246 start_codon:yes stop_codon:yes gene_type:complete
MKIHIQDWLYSILKDYPKKEVKSIYQNFIDDKIAYKFLKQQYKTNKKNFEINLLKDLKKNKDLLLKQEKDHPKVFRPPKLY